MGKAASQAEGAAHVKALWSQGTHRGQLRAVPSRLEGQQDALAKAGSRAAHLQPDWGLGL